MAFEEMARLAQGTRRDAAPTDPGADGSGAPTPGWKHHGSTPPSIEECWELVSRRRYLTDHQALRMCHPLFRTHGWIEDKERVLLIGKRWIQLIKDRVLRVALARRVSPDKAAHDLDEQLRHFFAGGSKVATGQLSALLDEAINDVTASARSGADPLTRDSVIGGSRQNRQNQQNQ
ncbi:hypothetical protein [Actinokineospora alba]|nr:hypothetical protein [Actinokineospora alba]